MMAIPLSVPVLLAVLAVFSATPVESINRALEQTCWQSSDYNGAVCSRAVDGEDSSDYNDNSCTHTNTEDHAWWAVDLGAVYTIRQVVVINRDMQRVRSANFTIAVTMEAPPVDSVNELDGYTQCAQYSGTPYMVTPIDCAADVSGRYVYIYISKEESLTLCEVEVYDIDTPAVPVNLALNKDCWESSVAYDAVCSRGNDGKDSSDFGDWTCTHTIEEEHAWWAVDLGGVYRVTSLEVTSRDWLFERNTDFIVAVTTDSPPVSSTTDLQSYTRCGQHSGIPEEVSSVTCAADVIGQYVYIYLTESEALTVCEVTVFGDCEESLARIPLKHAHGGVPFIDVSSVTECKELCLADPACEGIDWNFTDSAWMDTHCWLHMAPYGELEDNERADHYRRDRC